MSTPNTQVDSKRREQSNVLSRFFPLSAKQSNNSPSQELGVGSGNNVNPKQRSCVVEPKFLKVRIVTWNMHDSLPKGCLEELLGKVPYFESVSTYSGTFPPLANDANHPFHLVVIAGQECPTPSGIPMGLGAGFKLIDKDRREYDKDDKPNPEGKDKDTVEEHREGNHEKLSNGWTQMLEDWLCNGHGANSIASPSSSEIGTPRPLVRQRPKEPRKGPYQLLTKDRLMGIYLALYIHRDLKPLVQGISKASVTTGLIGGRLGNKGGVGISVKIDGATFLFLNAHLAAHEGKVNHRLANLAKIKTELDVDTFLASDDPRAMAEDLTDKFDYTFLFGDLNFRLDISRLHADWLISHQEYAQAFAFDQLNAVMKKGAAFDGFHEAPIDFPPTFKYDVQRTRRPKRLKTLRPGKQFPFQIDKNQAEVVEYGGDEAADVVSLSSTSTHSRTIVEQAWDVSNQAEPPTPNLVESNRIGLNSTKLSKPKWLSILSPSVVTTPRLPRFLHPDSLTSSPVTPHTTLSSLFPESVTTVKNIPAKKRFIRPPPMILTPSSASQSSFFDGDLEEDKGVYDSSSKQRVPSWCDRILWKTTIIKDPVPIENSNPQTRRRVSQFFVNAFRSPSRTSSRDPNGANVPANRSPTSMGVIAETRALTAVPSNNKHREPLSSRRAKTTFTPPPTAPLVQLSPRRSTTGSSERPRSASASIWRFLPAFLSPSHTTPAETLQPPTHPTYIKGDVVCLNYGTLDDREMGRLEGRSDHRPVIGAYKVYI